MSEIEFCNDLDANLAASCCESCCRDLFEGQVGRTDSCIQGCVNVVPQPCNEDCVDGNEFFVGDKAFITSLSSEFCCTVIGSDVFLAVAVEFNGIGTCDVSDIDLPPSPSPTVIPTAESTEPTSQLVPILLGVIALFLMALVAIGGFLLRTVKRQAKKSDKSMELEAISIPSTMLRDSTYFENGSKERQSYTPWSVRTMDIQV